MTPEAIHPSSPPDGSVAVLLYHDVVDRQSARRFRRFAVSPRQLDEHLSALEGAGYRTVTIAELTAGRAPIGAPIVALTFDDGYASFPRTVVPMLESRHMRASLFVPTAFVGGRAQWLDPESEGSRLLVSWSDLADLEASGIEIGSHGHRHLELDAISRTEALFELEHSRTLLEDRLGSTVRILSYPFGYHDREVRRAARDCGYDAACEVGYGLHRLGSDPLSIRRLLITPNVDPEDLLSLVTAGTPTFVQRARRATRPAWRWYRRSRAKWRASR